MKIPEEAIEAARDSLCRQIAEMSVIELTTQEPSAHRDIARAALEAAAPLLMAQAWDEGAQSWYANEKPANPYRP